MHRRQVGLPQTTQASAAGSLLCLGQNCGAGWSGASADSATGADAATGAGAVCAADDLAIRKPGGAAATGAAGTAEAGGRTGALGIASPVGGAADCWRITSLANSVASALQLGQAMDTGIRPLTG